MNAYEIRQLANQPKLWNKALLHSIADKMTDMEWLIAKQTATLNELAENARKDEQTLYEAIREGIVASIQDWHERAWIKTNKEIQP